MPATKKMISFAKDIACELSIDEPDFDNYDETSEFINENKDEYYSSLDEF